MKTLYKTCKDILSEIYISTTAFKKYALLYKLRKLIKRLPPRLSYALLLSSTNFLYQPLNAQEIDCQNVLPQYLFTGEDSRNLTFFDFDLDGDLDAFNNNISYTGGGNYLAYFTFHKNIGDIHVPKYKTIQFFPNSTNIPFPISGLLEKLNTTNTSEIGLKDVTGDFYLDLLIFNENVSIYEGHVMNDSITFSSTPIFDEKLKDIGNKYADIDHDGLIDIYKFIYNKYEDPNKYQLVYFKNQGSLETAVFDFGQSLPIWTPNSLEYPFQNYELKDMDTEGDFDVEIVLGYKSYNQEPKEAFLLEIENTGLPNSPDFKTSLDTILHFKNIQAGFYAQFFVAGYIDIDNDGDKDLYYSEDFLNCGYCSADNRIHWVKNPTTGTQITTGKVPFDLIIYPNPVKNMLYINWDIRIVDEISIDIFNTNGALMHHEKAYNGQHLVDLSNITHGLLFYTISTLSQIISGEIIHE